MSCKSTLCLEMWEGVVDEWVSQVGRMLHEGVIYRHIVLTVPREIKEDFFIIMQKSCWRS